MDNCFFNDITDASVINYDASKFPSAIKYLREKSNLTIKELAKKIQVPSRTIEKLEKCGPVYITPSVRKICDFFDICYPCTMQADLPESPCGYIATLLKDKRNSLGMSVKDVAEKTQLARTTIYKLEAGKLCKKDSYFKIFNFLNLDSSLLESFLKEVFPGGKNNSQINLLPSPEKHNDKIILHTLPEKCHESNSTTFEDKFFIKLKGKFPYDNIVRSALVDYGIVFNYLSYSSTGKVTLFYPVEIKDSFDISIVKKIKMEYLVFVDYFTSCRNTECIEFSLCLIGENSTTFIDYKEILYNLFKDYKYLQVINFYFNELNIDDDLLLSKSESLVI